MKTNGFIEQAIKIMDEAKAKLEWTQFNHCNAYIGGFVYVPNEDGTVHKCTPIKSYNTIVGFVDNNDGIIYEYGKYSRTTSKQVTQICNQWFGYSYKRVLVDVDTYDRW